MKGWVSYLKNHFNYGIHPSTKWQKSIVKLDDVIQTLDEMQLLQITQFALTYISDEEAEKIKE